MLWTYALKLFAERFNVLKVDDYGINTMKKFSGKTTEISLRNEHKRAVQFMYWMKYCRKIYLDYPSGNPAHVQGSILVTHHLIQDQ